MSAVILFLQYPATHCHCLATYKFCIMLFQLLIEAALYDASAKIFKTVFLLLQHVTSYYTQLYFTSTLSVCGNTRIFIGI